MDLHARLLDLERDPAGTDRLDMESVLVDAGFERHDHGSVIVLRHPQWGMVRPFRSDLRALPVDYVRSTARQVRENLEREGKL